MTNNEILLIPYVTEKSSKMMEENQYVFLLPNPENKINIKQYFEKKYNVKVDKVNVLKRPSKKVNRGRITGQKREYIKVIIKINKESNKEKVDELF